MAEELRTWPKAFIFTAIHKAKDSQWECIKGYNLPEIHATRNLRKSFTADKDLP